MSWLLSMWSSSEGLTTIIKIANWGMALTILATFALTVFTIIATNRRETFLTAADRAQEERISAANKIAGESNQLAGEAMVEQERLRTNNLELQRTLEQERIERLRLEERFAPRSISAEQMRQAINALRSATQMEVSIRATNSTSESSRYADQIRTVFLAADWTAPAVFHEVVAGIEALTGVIVLAGTNSPSGGIVQKAFTQSDIPAQYAVDPSLPLTTVVIVVGQKPAQ